MSIAAIIVTRNRRDRVLAAIEATLSQTHPPWRLLVVDNASADGTETVLTGLPGITYLRSDVNGGYAAALKRAIEHCLEDPNFAPPDAFWLLDDDSEPAPGALASLIEAARHISGWGLVGMRGATLGWSGIRHLDSSRKLARRPLVAPGTRAVDAVLIDGAILSLDAVRVAGPPRADLFMMIEDMELSWRVGRAGFIVATLEDEQISRAHLGSGSQGGHWRKYYLSRNHVRWALESGSPRVLSCCLSRQVRLLAGALTARNDRRLRLIAHLRGIADGVRGRMGVVVDPGQF